MAFSLAIDRTVALDVNGSTQHIRICATRAGLPPLLVVQAGPGLPVLHEVTKFQRRLNLEADFCVGYWEQRGCGAAAPRHDARSVSLQQQVGDLRVVLRWLYQEAGERVTVFGISLGATIALQAVEHERDRARAVVAISPDSQTTRSDAAVFAFLQQQRVRLDSRRLSRRVTRLGRPPYVDSAAFQRRARLLADLGTIERGRTFSALLRETLSSMIATYGVAGTVTALRNLNAVQRKLLPELVSLNLFVNPPRVAIPVHYVFGQQDALTPGSIVRLLPATIAAPDSTVLLVPDAGHMVHFDQPATVRSIAVGAIADRRCLPVGVA
jgi:pimeloyl-ACP methyl ester carboxylesterase